MALNTMINMKINITEEGLSKIHVMLPIGESVGMSNTVDIFGNYNIM